MKIKKFEMDKTKMWSKTESAVYEAVQGRQLILVDEINKRIQTGLTTSLPSLYQITGLYRIKLE